MAKAKSSESVDLRAIELATNLLNEGPVSYLRVKWILDQERGQVHEPAEIWRALANSGLFTFCQHDSRFRAK